MPPKKEERKPLEPIFQPQFPFYQYIPYDEPQIESITKFLDYFKPELSQLLGANIFDNMETLCKQIGIEIHPSFVKPIVIQNFDDFDENQKFRNPEDEENENKEPQIIQIQSVRLDVCTILLFDYCCQQSGISTLKLCNNSLTNTEQTQLANLIINPENKIKKLFIDWNQVNVDFLRQVPQSINLEFLTLRCCQLSDEHIAALCQNIKQLKCLDLYDNQLSKASLEQIGSMLLNNQSIEFLGLAKNKIQSFEDLQAITKNLGKFLLSPEELEDYRAKEKERDAIIERNKKVKKKGQEEVVPILETLIQQDNNYYIIRNSKLWLINLSMNYIEDSSKEMIEKFLNQTGDNFQLLVEKQKEVWQEISNMNMKNKKLHTNTSQIETTIHNQSITSRREGTLLPNINGFQVLPQRKLKGFMELDDNQQGLIKQLKEWKREVMLLISERKAEEGLEITKKIITLCSKFDMNTFSQSLSLLASMYISARDFANGLFCYNVLRQLADITNDHRSKIHALVQLADLCKLHQLYDESKLFLKKALQYIWFIGDGEGECKIYDYLGILYYIRGNLKMAKEFHDRAMNYILEAKESVSRNHGIELVRSYSKKHHKSTNLNQLILTKLGLVQINENEIKLSTNFEFDPLLQTILEDEEFQVETSTPTQPTRTVAKNGYLMKDVNMFNSVRKLHERQSRLKYFEKKIPDLHLSRSLLKFSLEEQFVKRMTVDKKQQSIESYKDWLTKFHTYNNYPEQLSKVLINHLSPNRNLLGFRYDFKPMKKQLSQLISDMEMYIYEYY